jgi:DNA repair exonuclease SbcCD ATPase subunit
MEDAMPAKDIEIPKISAANTKKEMMEAYSRLKEQLKAQADAELKPEKAKKEKVEREISEVADSVSSDTVIQQINALKVEIGKSLSDISAKLEAETERYDKVKEAIAAKNAELEEIFGIERSAHALAALLEAQKLKRAEFENEMTEKKRSLEDEIQATRTEWQKEAQRHDELMKQKKQKDETAWQREKEEHDYLFKREKEQKTQELKDAIAALEKEMEAKKEAAEKALAEKENDLINRDVAVSERERTMSELQKRVEAFPAEMDAAVSRAVKEAVERMKAEARAREELLTKGFEGERNVLQTKIESLEKAVAAQAAQIGTLTRQIDNAYGKVQDIAVQAVSASQSRNKAGAEFKPSKIEPEAV